MRTFVFRTFLIKEILFFPERLIPILRKLDVTFPSSMKVDSVFVCSGGGGEGVGGLI